MNEQPAVPSLLPFTLIMTRLLTSIAVLAGAFTQSVSSFRILSVETRQHQPHAYRTSSLLFSSENDSPEEAPPPSLILDSDAVNQQMGQLKSKYPTAEADYLAAARKRAEEKTASVNDMSTDEEWFEANKKKSLIGDGMEDEWERSLEEAGNADSQILIPMSSAVDGEGDDSDDGSGPEPTLLI